MRAAFTRLASAEHQRQALEPYSIRAGQCSERTAAMVAGYEVGRVLYCVRGCSLGRRDVGPVRCRGATH